MSVRVPKQGLHFTQEGTEARRPCGLPRVTQRSQLCLGLHGRCHHLSSHSMAPYQDTATMAPAPTFQPLPQFITCHPTVPIWTHTCTSTNVPVQGFENWVTCRERAIKKVYLGHRPGPESFLPHPTSSQAWDSGSCHLEAKSPPSLHHGAHVHPWGPADALAHFHDPPQDVCPPHCTPLPPCPWAELSPWLKEAAGAEVGQTGGSRPQSPCSIFPRDTEKRGRAGRGFLRSQSHVSRKTGI